MESYNDVEESGAEDDSGGSGSETAEMTMATAPSNSFDPLKAEEEVNLEEHMANEFRKAWRVGVLQTEGESKYYGLSAADSELLARKKAPPPTYPCKWGCGVALEQSDTERHETQDCPKREIRCENEGCSKSVLATDFEMHVNSCRRRRIDCPMHCGKKILLAGFFFVPTLFLVLACFL